MCSRKPVLGNAQRAQGAPPASSGGGNRSGTPRAAIPELLAALRARGVQLRLDPETGRVLVRGAGRLSDDELAALRGRKAELAAHLAPEQEQAGDPPPSVGANLAADGDDAAPPASRPRRKNRPRMATLYLDGYALRALAEDFGFGAVRRARYRPGPDDVTAVEVLMDSTGRAIGTRPLTQEET